MEKDLQAHWERVYAKKPIENQGWYEEHPAASLKLIDRCELSSDSVILNVGAGASMIVDVLVKAGYTQLIANDLSAEALQKLKTRLGEARSKSVRWVVDDLTNPKILPSVESVDLWHDRAVLHFFTDQDDQDAYFQLLHDLVKPGGFVIIAAFNLSGASTCSGLPVQRYSQEMIQDKLDFDFSLLEAFDFTYIQPSGNERAYIYTLFQRLKQ
jgi:SAM-dependent methyltransferase